MVDPGNEEEIPEASTQRNGDEVAQGQTKWRREDAIRADKREHSPFAHKSLIENWGEDQQELDDWQEPDKWHRLSSDGVLWQSTGYTT